jgi:hypothetical protein
MWNKPCKTLHFFQILSYYLSNGFLINAQIIWNHSKHCTSIIGDYFSHLFNQLWRSNRFCWARMFVFHWLSSMAETVMPLKNKCMRQTIISVLLLHHSKRFHGTFAQQNTKFDVRSLFHSCFTTHTQEKRLLQLTLPSQMVAMYDDIQCVDVGESYFENTMLRLPIWNHNFLPSPVPFSSYLTIYLKIKIQHN